MVVSWMCVRPWLVLWCPCCCCYSVYIISSFCCRSSIVSATPSFISTYAHLCHVVIAIDCLSGGMSNLRFWLRHCWSLILYIYLVELLIQSLLLQLHHYSSPCRNHWTIWQVPHVCKIPLDQLYKVKPKMTCGWDVPQGKVLEFGEIWIGIVLNVPAAADLVSASVANVGKTKSIQL